MVELAGPGRGELADEDEDVDGVPGGIQGTGLLGLAELLGLSAEGFLGGGVGGVAGEFQAPPQLMNRKGSGCRRK